MHPPLSIIEQRFHPVCPRYWIDANLCGWKEPGHICFRKYSPDPWDNESNVSFIFSLSDTTHI